MENNYLDNEKFTKEIVLSIKNDKLTDNAVIMYKSIVDNMIKHKNYNGYTEDVKADMQNSSYYFFLKYWKNFKEGQSAFSYFTRMCQNGFHQEINRYYKYNKNFDLVYNETKQNIFDSEDGIDDDYM